MESGTDERCGVTLECRDERAGDWAAAEKEWILAISGDPQNARAWVNLGVALNRQNKQKKVTVHAGTIGLKDGTTLRSVLGAETSGKVINGEVALDLPAQTAVAFKAF